MTASPRPSTGGSDANQRTTSPTDKKIFGIGAAMVVNDTLAIMTAQRPSCAPQANASATTQDQHRVDEILGSHVALHEQA